MTPEFNLNFPYAYTPLIAKAKFKSIPEDFYVEEILGFEPCGSGEHVYLYIEKRQHNTQTIAEKIAELAEVNLKDVSYAGLKDKQAVTRQWFSVYLPKAVEPDWQQLQSDSVLLLKHSRHGKKLRRGEHTANFFRIRLRDIDVSLYQNDLQERLNDIAVHGCPNYFGEQRFGHEGQNLQQAHQLLVRTMGQPQSSRGSGSRSGRRVKQQGFKQRLFVSAARAWLFNQVLSERVRQDNWNVVLPGDIGEAPSACLWGRGRLMVAEQVEQIERQVVDEYEPWTNFLEHCGLQQERRPLVIKPQDLSYIFENTDLCLTFSLGKGEYATTLLRELCQLQAPLNTL